MLALTAVLLANLAAVFVAVALVGPAMFHRKLLLAGHPNEATELTHIEHAFQSVGFTAMIIGAIPGHQQSLGRDPRRNPGSHQPPSRATEPASKYAFPSTLDDGLTPPSPEHPRTAPSSR